MEFIWFLEFLTSTIKKTVEKQISEIKNELKVWVKQYRSTKREPTLCLERST
jgi:hypothetical protein